jgi:hypothetical protein
MEPLFSTDHERAAAVRQVFDQGTEAARFRPRDR